MHISPRICGGKKSKNFGQLVVYLEVGTTGRLRLQCHNLAEFTSYFRKLLTEYGVDVVVGDMNARGGSDIASHGRLQCHNLASFPCAQRVVMRGLGRRLSGVWA